MNQRQYEGLKAALQLNLRRQLLIAVCDNNSLQTQLVARLQEDLAPSDSAIDDFGSVALRQLTFDPRQPDLVVQLVHWLKQAPKPTPHLQVVGLEAMTQQSLRSQNHFLRSLEGIQALLPHLDSSLVLWLSWPWYRTLQQSAPDFWQWRSGVFTFVGEPVVGRSHSPVRPQIDGLYGAVATGQPPQVNADIWQILSEDLAQLEQPAKTEPAPAVEQIEPSPAQAAALDVTTLENPLETLAQLKDQGAAPQEIMRAYRTLGNHYRDRIEAGDMDPALLATAIQTFEIYLQWLPEGDDQRPAGVNDLGTLHWLQAQQQREPSALIGGMNRSLELYKTGLSAETDAETASRLHGNIGAVHSALANYEDSVTHLKDAVAAYRQALPFCSVETHPEEHGTFQNSLGSVYWKLAYYEQPQSYLHQAIAAYSEALRCHHPEKSPLDYAAVQNNLGIAYWSLSRHERSVFLLKHAIAAYRDALHYRTPTTDPVACASTYNNLGTAFWELANHPDIPAAPQGRYRQNAVIAYEAALKASELAPSNLDLASIRHCLGSIYDKMAQAADDQTTGNLQRALAHYVIALQQMPKTTAAYEPIFKALVRNVAMHYDILGLEGQQQALSYIPATLLPEVMLKL
ncbi:MAG: tetratricopeptide repeat protein [Cyanobacteria bacterium P01_A01_bin.15]